MKQQCSSSKCKEFALTLFPIASWLPKYQWKTDIVNDLIAGFTVAIMHIPQGDQTFILECKNQESFI